MNRSAQWGKRPAAERGHRLLLPGFARFPFFAVLCEPPNRIRRVATEYRDIEHSGRLGLPSLGGNRYANLLRSTPELLRRPRGIGLPRRFDY